MSFLDKLRTWWTFKQNSGQRGAQRAYILDCAGFLGSRRNGGRTSPSDQIQLLQRLARFAEKERIKLNAVLEGKELREVRNGGTYKGIVVHFADRSKSPSDIVVQLLKETLRRSPVTVITSDRHLEERVLVTGGTSMRGSTFKKALESVAGSSSGRNDSGGPRRRSSRNRRRPPRKKDKPGQDSDSSVRDLVDLVE